MPSKHVIREYRPDSYYHIYNRGVGKQTIFHDAEDKKQFLRIVARHLDPSNTDRRFDNIPYEKYCSQLELLSYCLMGNHFHMLVYVHEETDVMKKFMKSIGTAYTMYYNRKYKRVGSLFQGVYKASWISNDSYLLHITRYIHLNPRRWQTYHYSSLKNYLGQRNSTWLNVQRILDLFEGDNYLDFVADFQDSKNTLEYIKHELADW